MDLNEHHGAASQPEQPADRTPAQPHGGSAVAGLAGEFGAELVRAIRVGLAEVSNSGQGARGPSHMSWYSFATEYARAHWPGRAAKTRDEVSDALTAVTMAMLGDLPGRPNGHLLRRALRHWAFVTLRPGQGEMSVQDRLVLQWVAKASRPLVDLHDPVLARDVLESLRRKLDGSEAAVETMRRKRKVLVHALHYAVERGELGRCTTRALRPEEAVAVALPDCRLPRTGWGRLILHRTRPQAGKRWTDTGEFHDERGLKNRPPGETRVVPLPPHLVAMWREHVATFGTADDGRLFFTEQGRVVSYSTYHRVWRESRDLALSPALTSTPLAKRPYDLRHSALSTWLCAGADPAEVAQRAGNSVEVLLSRYAKCLYDRQSINNQRIEGLLSSYGQPPEPD
ncbi:site-specific integrase [Streptomyces sp. WMMC940]|uniref:site-specific integrase n=1 Tax=Streptomyces sp. WMMC940 TaxID=3015153 RepID=UPI0022B6004A|nr:site-specific integrase [Streptomyces sp. WMMC940]MCZ7457979.1 site-specific integrase [Streptomyces sp. WMMC940]